MSENKIKLDLGCGKEKKDGFIGIDINPQSQADIIASALNLPFKENSVDEIYSRHVGEHFSPIEIDIFFKEIYRVLKPGSKAFLKIDRDWSKKRLLKKDSTHAYRYSTEEIRQHLKNFKFSKVKNTFYFTKTPDTFLGYTFYNKIFVWLEK
ncbi:MAG TPA: class I SAM-dependent methyltransferase [bacterium]|nr:class I SAM-dependent methyltransferase [bacterium]